MAAPGDGLAGRSAVELAGLLAKGEVSAREVLADHLARIEARNGDVNAVVTLTAEPAGVDAAAADQAFAEGRALGALHGLPVAHKDLFMTAGVRTTMGSPLFADWVPDPDALVVARAKAAGAISVGKTNTPEFGAGSQTFNPVFGPTRNPWALGRTCGGSSGGAAAALAAGMVPLADGSDMGGSLRNPASFCGVVGLRPSPGRVPSWPSRYPWGALGVEGPMARSVADLALFLGALAGPDPRCPLSISEPGAELTAGLQAARLDGLRVAWSPTLGDLPVEADVLAVLDGVRTALEGAGARVDEADPPLGGADEAFETLRAFQFELGFGALYERSAEQMKETVRWNVEAGRRLTGPDIGRAERLRGEVFEAVAGFFERFDVLATTVSQVPPFPVDVEYPTVVAGRQMGSYIEWMRSCSRITVTACPALSLPAGFTPDGLPVGVQLVAPYRAERRLLAIALSLEELLAVPVLAS
jgi:amidase